MVGRWEMDFPFLLEPWAYMFLKGDGFRLMYKTVVAKTWASKRYQVFLKRSLRWFSFKDRFAVPVGHSWGTSAGFDWPMPPQGHVPGISKYFRSFVGKAVLNSLPMKTKQFSRWSGEWACAVTDVILRRAQTSAPNSPRVCQIFIIICMSMQPACCRGLLIMEGFWWRLGWLFLPLRFLTMKFYTNFWTNLTCYYHHHEVG